MHRSMHASLHMLSLTPILSSVFSVKLFINKATVIFLLKLIRPSYRKRPDHHLGEVSQRQAGGHRSKRFLTLPFLI